MNFFRAMYHVVNLFPRQGYVDIVIILFSSLIKP